MMSLSDDKQADVIMRLTLQKYIWMILKILIMFILTIWSVKYTLQTSN